MALQTEFVASMGGTPAEIWDVTVPSASRTTVATLDLGPGRWIVGLPSVFRTGWSKPGVWIGGVQTSFTTNVAPEFNYVTVDGPTTVEVEVQNATAVTIFKAKI